jgi:hypothetical protein
LLLSDSQIQFVYVLCVYFHQAPSHSSRNPTLSREFLDVIIFGARYIFMEHSKRETSPKSFYLDVYFNAQQISHDGKNKQKPSNALVQSSIAYQGGPVEFAVDQDKSEV